MRTARCEGPQRREGERVQLSADVTMNQRLEQERELFSRLSVQQMEEIAAEAQALVDRMMAMVRAVHTGVLGAAHWCS